MSPLTKALFILSIFPLVTQAQISVNNEGTIGLGANCIVYCDGNFENENGASWVFNAATTSDMYITGNITNGTTATLTSGIGTIHAQGAANQDLDCGGDNFYNFTVNNSSGDVDLTSPLIVLNAFTLTLGDLNTTSSNVLTLGSSGSSE